MLKNIVTKKKKKVKLGSLRLLRLASIVSVVTACYSDKSLHENTDGLN